MKNIDLAKFNWTGVTFGEQGDKKIIILTCLTLVNANALLDAIRTNPFDIKVIIREPQKTFSFEIDFHTEDLMCFDSVFTEENYPTVKWVKLQQITHVTTAYRDKHGKLQLSPHLHPLTGNLYLN